MGGIESGGRNLERFRDPIEPTDATLGATVFKDADLSPEDKQELFKRLIAIPPQKLNAVAAKLATLEEPTLILYPGKKREPGIEMQAGRGHERLIIYTLIVQILLLTQDRQLDYSSIYELVKAITNHLRRLPKFANLEITQKVISLHLHDLVVMKIIQQDTETNLLWQLLNPDQFSIEG